MDFGRARKAGFALYGFAGPGRQAQPVGEVDGERAADRAQKAAGLGGSGDQFRHGGVLEQDTEGAGAGGGVGDAGVDPAAARGKVGDWQARSGRVRCRRADSGRADLGECSGFDARDEGAEALGEAAEALGEEEPNGAGNGAVAVGRRAFDESLAANDDDAGSLLLTVGEDGDGLTEPSEEFGEAGCDAFHVS